MTREKCVIHVKVITHVIIQEYSGNAMKAGIKPRFVVALQLLDTKAPLTIEGSDVTLTTHRALFFAVDSVAKTFGDADVIGKQYRLLVEQRELDGKRSFFVGLAPPGAP